MTAALRILAYGCSGDLLDEYIKIAESTFVQSMHKSCQAVIQLYEGQYLRHPNDHDVARLLRDGEEPGFPGMIGSLDCMHWEWKNCPTTWHGSHRGKGKPTFILEAVASRDLWIWHAYFGMPGAHNDITILDHSPIFNYFISGRVVSIRYTVNDQIHTIPYYLTDDIYPKYATLMQTIPHLNTPKERLFAQRQAAVRKDVERAFGVLQIKWGIAQGPVRFWKTHDLANNMKTCIILHNMIIEDERGLSFGSWDRILDDLIPEPVLSRNPGVLAAYISVRMRRMRDTNKNARLRSNLMEHLWNKFDDGV